MTRIIYSIYAFLLVGSSLIVSANDCSVRKKYNPKLWNGDPLKMLAFISDEEVFTCMLIFHGLDSYLYYDKIVLTNNGNKVIETINGNIEYLKINSTLSATGWNEFTFSIDDNSTFMAKVRDKLVFNYTVAYPVKTITTYASNISLCSSPSWAVGENEAIVIPLYASLKDNEGVSGLKSNSSFKYLTLSSTASFIPVIKIDGIKRFLTMKNQEILLSQDFFQPLPLKKYVLEVHTQKQKVNIYYKLDNLSKKLMEFQVATVLSNIEISSQGMSFTVNLDLSSVVFTTVTTTVTKTINTTITSSATSAVVVATNDGTSAGLVVGIIIAVFALLALVMIIIIIYIKRKRSRFQKQNDLTDGNNRFITPEEESLIENKNDMSDDRDQFKMTAKEILEDSEKKGTTNSDDMSVKKVQENKSLAQRELLSPFRLPSDHDVTIGHPIPRFTSSRPKSIHDSLTYGSQSANVQFSHGKKYNHQKSSPSLFYPPFVPPLAVDRNSYKSRLFQSTSELCGYVEHKSDESLSVSEENFEDKMYQNQELCMSVIDKVEMYVTKGDDERAIETLINAIFHLNKSEVAHDERCKDLIMTLQDQLDDLNPEIEDHTNEHRAQPPHVASASYRSQSSSQFTLLPDRYQPGVYIEHRSNATPVLSEAEIEVSINRINEVSSSVIDEANAYVSLGEYSDAREILSNAISLINQSELQVTYDERFKDIIRSLQDTLIEVKSGGSAPSPSPRRNSHERPSLRASDFRERSRSNSRERSRSNSRESSRSNSRERSLLNHGEKSGSNSSEKFTLNSVNEDVINLGFRSIIMEHIRNRKDKDGNKKWKYVWSHKSNILCRTEEESHMMPRPKPHIVKRMADLLELQFTEDEIKDIIDKQL